ncbi:MAG TPA: hypothetical protein VF032_00045 [Thermoleophilaceae bacterium]
MTGRDTPRRREAGVPPPPPPPTGLRLLHFPVPLARELRSAAGRYHRSLWWRARRWRSFGLSTVRRAWARTDPHHIRRTAAAFTPLVARSATLPPPPPGTAVTLRGELGPALLVWSALQLDGRDLDYALIAALNIKPRTEPFVAEITVRVAPGRMSRSQRAVELADQVVAAPAARRELERLCRQAGVPAEILLEEAAARARAKTSEDV